MEKKTHFEKAREILELLNGLSFYECNSILESINKRLKYVQKNNSFIFEEPQIL